MLVRLKIVKNIIKRGRERKREKQKEKVITFQPKQFTSWR